MCSEDHQQYSQHLFFCMATDNLLHHENVVKIVFLHVCSHDFY